MDPAADARPVLGAADRFPTDRAATTSTARRRSPTSAPGTSSTTRTAGGWTPAAGPTSTASSASRTSSSGSDASRCAARTDDPSIAPDLADHLIPNLTADQSFDRECVQRAGPRVHGALREHRRRDRPSTTLPWERAHTERPGRARREAARGRRDARHPPGRGADPHHHDRAARRERRGRECACGPSVRRAGRGAQRLRRAERRRQHRAGAPGEGVRERRRREQPRRARRHQRDPLRRRPTWPRPSSCQSIVPGAQLVEDSSRAGTDIVLVLGKDFHGLGSTATTGAPGATTTTLSPEAACV